LNDELTCFEKILILSKLITIKLSGRDTTYRSATAIDDCEVEELFSIPKLNKIKNYISELSGKYKFTFWYGDEDIATEWNLEYNSSTCEVFLKIIQGLYESKDGEYNNKVTNFNELVQKLHGLVYAGSSHSVPVYASINDSKKLANDIISKMENKDSLIHDLTEQISELHKELDYIQSFSPAQIENKLSKLSQDICLIKKTISNNDLLKSFLPTLTELENYSNDIAKINKSYREIYLNILQPIKNDSNKGIKTTVRWAIISIIITTAVSLLITILINSSLF
jgi:hypothetical protein